MRSLNTYEAKSRLSELLADVEDHGATILICRNGRPIAELRPVARGKDPLRPHPKLSKVVFHEDPVRPLDPDDWPDAT